MGSDNESNDEPLTVSGHVSGEHSAVAASPRPLTPADYTAALRAAGVGRGDTVIVHSSLSRLGWTVGGPMAVVAALLDVLGVTSDPAASEGTIVMPAQTGIGDPSAWENPPVPESWWPIIRAEWPPFDPGVSPLRAMGAVAECVRRLPGVRHSGHPATGFVAVGRHADLICAHQPLSWSLGDDGPLGRLYDLDALVLLLGVGHGNNTSLHLAEHRALVDTGHSAFVVKRTGAPLLVDGKRAWVEYDEVDFDDEDFPALAEAFVAEGGAEARTPLGLGEVRACRMREIVDFGTNWLTAHRRR